jgi:hypothetical protein
MGPHIDKPEQTILEAPVQVSVMEILQIRKDRAKKELVDLDNAISALKASPEALSVLETFRAAGFYF